MHEIYCEHVSKTTDEKPVSRQVFVEILRENKIDIHQPRKDQCDTCTSFKVGTLSKEEYSVHIQKKDEARDAKNDAKKSASEEKVVLTMDLQSVLIAPKIEASSAYYKMKLQIHNFTIYRLNDKAVSLYVWHEGNGGVTCNEFTSCIVDYISKCCEQHKSTHFVLISDGCGYQNRNKVLSSALARLAAEKKVVIEQLYLERGHTMMEADSVHATLDQLFKAAEIYAPSDYLVHMRQARPGQRYSVTSVDFNFFRDFEHVSGNLASIRPGKKVGDPQVTDLRGLLYLPSNQIQYKLRHTDQWKNLPVRNALENRTSPRKLYKKPLKINADKHKHLQALKECIPTEYHSFYDSLESAD